MNQIKSGVNRVAHAADIDAPAAYILSLARPFSATIDGRIALVPSTVTPCLQDPSEERQKELQDFVTIVFRDRAMQVFAAFNLRILLFIIDQ
jgi:hypothetical protein